VALLRLPPDLALPEPLCGRFVARLRFVHLGSAEEGAATLAPMRAVATPLMDLVDEMPYAAIDGVHMDPTEPMRVRERGVTLGALPAAAVDALLAVAGPDVPAPLAMVEIRVLGGAITRGPESRTPSPDGMPRSRCSSSVRPSVRPSRPSSPARRPSSRRSRRGPAAGCSTSSVRPHPSGSVGSGTTRPAHVSCRSATVSTQRACSPRIS
jgi:hypothetical protein